MKRIAIVDDEPDWLERMKIVLDSEPDFEVVATYESASEALDKVPDTEPDILITDINMPKMGGVELIGSMKVLSPELTIIALSALEETHTIIDALRSGAVGYLLKTDSASNLCDSLRSAVTGGAPLSQKVARRLVEQFQAGSYEQPLLLTKREREILKGAENGQTYQETADQLGISVHTVHNQVRRIFEKLHARNKMEAIAIARKKGLI